jgi:hypothetical protein
MTLRRLHRCCILFVVIRAIPWRIPSLVREQEE